MGTAHPHQMQDHQNSVWRMLGQSVLLGGRKISLWMGFLESREESSATLQLRVRFISTVSTMVWFSDKIKASHGQAGFDVISAKAETL